ncbi:hypothetical protein [Alloalcanivorax xenomutans]|jgi:hypothetical protein|uniref:hypothetical protein n=1 Tax=Alloalcanivorax xenomutans TaxID=1094342 RepID=UPI00047DFBFB|nr:hypothetical protein [Alcanivorax sp.]
MKIWVLVFAFFFVATLSACSKADVIVLDGARSCFSGKLIEKSIVRGGGDVRVLRISDKCLDDDSIDDFAPRPGRKNAPGGVDLKVCTSGFRACGNEEDEKNVVYLSFFVPKGSFLRDLIGMTKRNEEIIRKKEKIEIYKSKAGGVSIVPSNEEQQFRVKCWKEEFSPCDMVGVSDGGLQYSASFRYSSVDEDWALLHDKINAFLKVGLSVE